MSELVEIAILAYRNNRFRDAIELLVQVIDEEPSNWMARMYLGMSYEKAGRAIDAHRLFKRLSGECPDDHIRAKANGSLPLLEAEMRRRFQKEQIAAGVGRKNKDKTSYNDDIVWVG
jgi:cytochrome c-type biogenesis protein CcmH/NrfG